MPQKFKPLNFVKYDGTNDPYAYLHMFCRKMTPYGDNQPLLIQTFPDNLIGFAATWYLRLGKTLSWREDGQCLLGLLPFQHQDSS